MKRTRHAPRYTPFLCVCLCAAALAFAGCGKAGGPLTSSPVVLEHVIFQQSVSYDQAVAAIADLGLRVSLPCKNDIAVSDAQTYPIKWVRWAPVDQSLNYPRSIHSIWVTATPSAPADWRDRLYRLPAVSRIPENESGSCAQHVADTSPMPGVLYYLTQDQTNTYARVTLGQGSVPYDTAVANLNNLGLRLADVCYEQDQAQGRHPTWHAMGQEQAYQASGSLVVAPTTDASDHWQEQVRALAGVATIQMVTASGCGQ